MPIKTSHPKPVAGRSEGDPTTEGGTPEQEDIGSSAAAAAGALAGTAAEPSEHGGQAEVEAAPEQRAPLQSWSDEAAPVVDDWEGEPAEKRPPKRRLLGAHPSTFSGKV